MGTCKGLKILATGTVDFIGFHLAKKLLEDGYVKSTYSDMSGLMDDFGYKPNTDLKDGIEKFIKRYKEFYSVK